MKAHFRLPDEYRHQLPTEGYADGSGGQETIAIARVCRL